MAGDLNFNIGARFEEAARAFNELGNDVEQLKRHLDELDRTNADPKVTLDLTDLTEKLDKAVAELDKLNEKQADPKVDLDIAAAEARAAQIIAKLDELNAKESSPKVDADIAMATAQLAIVQQRLSDLKDKKLQVDVDIASATAKIAALKSELTTMLAGITDKHVKIDLDTKDGVANARAFVSALENSLSGITDKHVKVDVDTSTAVANVRTLLATLTSSLAAIPDKHVNVDVDTKDGVARIRELSSAVDSFAGIMSMKMGLVRASILPALESIGQLSGALGLIPAVATGVGTALATVVVGTQGMGEALKASAAATKAQEDAAKADATAQRDHATAMQAATAAGTANVASLKQAVAEGAANVASLKAQKAAGADVSDQLKAAETAQLGNVAALKQAQAAYTGNASAATNASAAQKQANSSAAAAEAAHKAAAKAADEQAAAMKNLAPAAQGVVSAIIQLGPAFTALRMDVQQHLFDGLKQSLLDMANTALPVVRTGLTQMADSLNKAAKNVSEFIQQQSSVTAWREIFTNVATAAGNLANAVKPILQIITDVTKVGSQFLPQLAQHFAEAAQRAADFVSNAEKTGQLAQWIQAGIDAVKLLWSAFKDVVAIIKDLSQSSPFGPSFLEALKGVTASIRWLIENIPGLTSLVQAFFTAWLFAKVTSGLIGMVTTIGNVATALGLMKVAGAEAAVAETAVGTAATGLLGPLALLAAAALLAFSPEGQARIMGLRDAIDKLLGTTRDANGVVTGFGASAKEMASAAKDTTFDISNLGEAVKKMKNDIATNMGPIPAIAQAAIGGLVPIINTGVANIATAVGKIPPLIQASLVQLAPAMRAPTEAALAGLLPIITSGMQNITNQVQGLSPKVQAALAPLTPAMQQAANAAIGGMLPIISDGVNNITSTIGGVTTAVNAVPTSHGTTFTGDGASLLAAAAGGKAAIQGVVPDWLTKFAGDTANLVAAAEQSNTSITAVPADHLSTFLGETGDIVAKTASSIAAINSVPADHNTQIQADDQATSVIQSIISALSSIPTFIQTVVQTVYQTVGGAGGLIMTPMQAGGVVGMATGSQLSPNMSGTTARVVGPNSWRVIGDRMTDDEAFIPINSSSWSKAILGETANRMGYALMPMAGGGTLITEDDPRWDWRTMGNLRSGSGTAGGSADALSGATSVDAGFNLKVTQMRSGGILYGSVSQSEWDRLLAEGWRGDPNDGREALYPPWGGSSGGGKPPPSASQYETQPIYDTFNHLATSQAGFGAGNVASITKMGHSYRQIGDSTGLVQLPLPAAGGGAGGGGTPPPVHVHCHFSADGLDDFGRSMMTFLRKGIRGQGGNVQFVLGSG